MAKIVLMGKFTAIGMRTKVEDKTAMVVNTCGKNDTDGYGDHESWVWSNPTNRAIIHPYEGYQAVSVECLWQGTKIFCEGGTPDELTLKGDWRRGKAKRPIGAWAGEGRPLIRTPGQARRQIYVPAFRNLYEYWSQDTAVCKMLVAARTWNGPVFLRDHDTGRGIDRNGPMSHSWLMCEFLNTGCWPG
jgi:hypothetical protein